ncbi:hypothetical protein D3C72_2427480 [compost metagenome]
MHDPRHHKQAQHNGRNDIREGERECISNTADEALFVALGEVDAVYHRFDDQQRENDAPLEDGGELALGAGDP